MPLRAYVAHDKAVSVVRMYIQMAVVGLVLAAVLYSVLMATFLSHYFVGPVPQLRSVNGSPRLVVPSDSTRLPLLALLKYYLSLNPRNYLGLPLNGRPQRAEKTELVDSELLPFFRQREVSRQLYRKGIYLITRGRVEELRWIFPLSLGFFPLFGLGYFFLFGWVNQHLSKTRFIRGANLTPLRQIKKALKKVIEDEEGQS